jgi:hypothetical protein
LNLRTGLFGLCSCLKKNYVSNLVDGLQREGVYSRYKQRALTALWHWRQSWSITPEIVELTYHGNILHPALYNTSPEQGSHAFGKVMEWAHERGSSQDMDIALCLHKWLFPTVAAQSLYDAPLVPAGQPGLAVLEHNLAIYFTILCACS